MNNLSIIFLNRTGRPSFPATTQNTTPNTNSSIYLIIGYLIAILIVYWLLAKAAKNKNSKIKMRFANQFLICSICCYLLVIGGVIAIIACLIYNKYNPIDKDEKLINSTEVDL